MFNAGITTPKWRQYLCITHIRNCVHTLTAFYERRDMSKLLITIVPSNCACDKDTPARSQLVTRRIGVVELGLLRGLQVWLGGCAVYILFNSPLA